MAGEGRKLSESMRSMLEAARHHTDDNRETVGVMAVERGQTTTLRALERRGLVSFVDYGRHVDGDNGDGERAIYAITDSGRAALRKDPADAE